MRLQVTNLLNFLIYGFFFSGGVMCDSTPIGELCETRVAMMKSDTETFTNGHGENQEVTVAAFEANSW